MKLYIAAWFVATVFAAFPAFGQEIACGTRDVMLGKLNIRGESKTGEGLDSRGNIVEHWASPLGATWSMTFTDVSGLMCVGAYGTLWNVGPAEEMSGSPA